MSSGAANLLLLLGDVLSDRDNGGECYVESGDRPALRTLIRGELALLARTERIGGKRYALANLTSAGWRAYWALQGTPVDPRHEADEADRDDRERRLCTTEPTP